ncbi:hypothetical protein Catovirus_1_1019 [Catovirus CTV1]|uniref:Uncharacterized protein n=1 Tax=Catovirus CTV1 TaxID=1977631 RepID=A0A1V0SB96_9VIRU|nr:hypothetical protein Catovirus_1_1019 [Catovirus CTV1]
MKRTQINGKLKSIKGRKFILLEKKSVVGRELISLEKIDFFII